LHESLGRPGQAEAQPAPVLPASADQVRKLSWDQMTLVFARSPPSCASTAMPPCGIGSLRWPGRAAEVAGGAQRPELVQLTTPETYLQHALLEVCRSCPANEERIAALSSGRPAAGQAQPARYGVGRRRRVRGVPPPRTGRGPWGLLPGRRTAPRAVRFCDG
jgi:hypothetical protein